MRPFYSLLIAILLLSSFASPIFGQRAAGDDCSEPLEVVIDWDNLPYQLLGETTCGRSNDYDATCLGNYDGGEDFVLEFELQWLMSVLITLTPHSTSFTGVLVSDHCPPDGDCLAFSTQNGISSHEIVLPYLEPGTYYIMVDNWPSPDCIPEFDLQIEEIFIDNPGINCGFPAFIDCSPPNFPFHLDWASTCGLGNDYDNTCLGEYDGGEDMTFEIEVPFTTMIDIVLDPHGTDWTGIVIDDVCPPGHDDCIAMSTNMTGTKHAISNVELQAGTYYLMVDTWPAPDCIPQFELFIDESFNHQLGDDCGLPQYLSLPDELPITLSHQYTWGRGNDYHTTCLGDYDEGEDYVLQLDVSAPVCVDVTLEPLGHTGTGLAISAVCPPGAECLASSTSDAATSHGVEEVSLGVGTYYVLVDCSAATGSIDDFNLRLEACPLPPENDKCEDAIAIGNVIELPFSTSEATLDGPAECQSSPNIWYCWTAANNGVADFNLCGSDYDTYLAVYDGCDCGALGDPLGCNDDFCGLQSQLMIEVVAYQEYLIEIGGSGGAVGEGVLTAYIPSALCGDVNGDGLVNITDAVYLINWIFNGGPAPSPLWTGDVNLDELIGITDAVYLIQFIFNGGPEPCSG